MSEENTELVKSVQPTDVDLVDLFPENDVAAQSALNAFPAVFAEDFTVQFIAATSGMRQPEYHGVDGLAEPWRDWLVPWASYRLDVEDLIDAGDQIVVFVRARDRTVRDSVIVEHSSAAIAIAVWPEQWDDYQLEIVQFVDAGDHVVVRTHQSGRGKGSGVAVEDEIWFVFGLRNGRVAEWRMFGAEREALEAAGL